MNFAFYALARRVVWLILRAIGRISVVGTEHVPASGPVIVACNHAAYLDPPALGCVAPRPVAYMAKKQLFDIPVLGPVIRLLGAFPVDRSRGDIAAIKAALAVLATGACLGIFPEGTRTKDGVAGAPQMGVALLAAMSGATVVPVYVSGTAGARRFAKITVVFGRPVANVPARKASREDLAKWTGELMNRIYALREKTGAN